MNSCSYVAILGQICFGTPAPKSCDSCSKHLMLKFHSSEVMFSSWPAPAFPAASVCCAKVPWVPKVLRLAVPRNALPVVALNARVPTNRRLVRCCALGVLLPESPAGCKSTRARQAHLINRAVSLSRGSAAAAAAILLFNCSAFCLVSRMPILFFFFSLPKANQRHTSVRMPCH